MRFLLLAGAGTLALAAAGEAAAGTDYSTAWHAQIGDTAAVQATAKGGAGVTIGVVDTGVQAANPEIAGRVSSLSACAAVTFACPNGAADDNGHGTAVASIAAGKFDASAPISMSGVAPSATIVAEKVLNASGSGYDTDVANGIIKATQAGARVINLSLSYIPTPAVISAVNYAANDNVVIVWAGGNSAAPLNGGANTAGFSAAVATHLIFAGSVSANDALSSFSNTPGAGQLTAGASTANYASLWLMAPGENIVAPGVQFGSGAYAYWTGTSMSTPEISGAVALLEAAWPILYRNGTVTQVLFKTATDLGAPGVDSKFGNGLLNLAQAFQPIGPLSVIEANGKSLPVSSLTGALVSSGALGPLSQLKTQLSAYTAFDSFSRNFTVNLSALIAQVSNSPNAQGLIGTATGAARTLALGGLFTLVAEQAPSFGEGVFGPDGTGDVGADLLGLRRPTPTYAEFAGGDGRYLAAGRGVASSLSFARAAWGADDLAAEESDALGVANALLNLAQGGYSASFGGAVLGPLRVAAGWSASPTAVGSALANDRTRSQAKVTTVTVTDQINRRWRVGLTMSDLAETNALLGTTYDGVGPLSLGANRQSRLLGLSSVLDLGARRSVMVEASVVRTDGAANSGGLIQSVSPVKAVAWGVSFIQGDALAKGDSLSISLRQPLRVVSGSASLAVTTVDSQGDSATVFTPVSLVPTGHETDVTAGYAAPVSDHTSFRGAISLRADADNTAGLTDVTLKFGMRVTF